FNELDRHLESRSTDFEEMRRLLAQLKETKDVSKWLDSAQDQLYASIASAHLKVLSYLEDGNIDEAKREACAAIRWFQLRFHFFSPEANGRIPKIVETFNGIAALAEKSAALRAVLKMSDDEVSAKFSPGGRR